MFSVPFLFILFVYLHNLSHDVYGGDIGDLVTAGFVMGVPHPPGYPLFTLLVFLLSKLPITATVAYKAGLISVASSILGLLIYFFHTKNVTKNVAISYLGAFILAFSYLFWFYAEIAEVFALNNLFLIALLVLSIKFYKDKKTLSLFLLSFIAGLSLTNHHTILLIFPSLFVLVFSHYKLFLRKKTLIIKSFFLFLAGLLPYAYIPIAASRNPVINWDNAVNIENFLHLILRKGYGTFSPGSFTPAIPEERFLIFREFLTVTISSITFPTVVICLIGVFYLIKKREYVILTSLLLAYSLIGPFFSIYAGFPLVNAFVIGVAERFYISSTIILMFIFPYGMKAVFQFFNSFFSKKLYAYILLAAFFLIPILLFKYNYQRTDLSKTTIGSEFGKNILQFMPSESVLFVNGDTAVFNTWYVHYVENVRPDIVVIRVGDFKTNAFTQPYRISYRQKNITEDEYEWVVKEIMKKHRVYFNNVVKFQDKNLEFIQYGLVAELISGGLPSKEKYQEDIDRIWNEINIPQKENLAIYERNLTTSHIASYYADALSLTANNLFYKYDNKEKAREFLNKALLTDNRIARTYASMSLLLSAGFKECKEAEEFINIGIRLNPIAQEYQAILYDIYANCYKDQRKVDLFKKQYKGIYGKDFVLPKTIDSK